MPAISCTTGSIIRVPRILSAVQYSWRLTTCNKKPRCFSSSTIVEPTDHRLPFSVNSLGLDRAFLSPPEVASIRQLPEVETAWKSFPSVSAVDNLKRAADVFAGFAKGGHEHLAVCAMLAECHHRVGDNNNNNSNASLPALKEILQLNHSAANVNVQLAIAKVFWIRGDFDRALRQCEALLAWLQQQQQQQEATSSIATIASAMNGKALAQLAALSNPNDIDNVLASFQDVVEYLETNENINHSENNHILLAAAHAHWGVAEVICGSLWIQEKESMGDAVTTMEPLETWGRGLQILTDQSDSSPSLAALLIQANLHANLAWGILPPEGVPVSDSNERISAASEHASKAIKAIDAVGTREGLARILAIVASCYHQGGHAVTAEGLFQSAIDRKQLPPGPLALLELQEALRGYSKLCQSWDKRQVDAERLATQADEIDSLLPEAWRGKSGMLHSSLWFWTPADFS